MKWLNALAVVLKRLLPSVSPVRGQSCHQTSAGDCHTAPITSGKPLTVDHAPLASLHSKRESLAARYSKSRSHRDLRDLQNATHRAMSKELFSDGL